LPGTNALAYYEKSKFRAVKSFITLAPGHDLTLSTVLAEVPAAFEVVAAVG
jgi:hypothetical protein